MSFELEKESEIENEVAKWDNKNTNYKARVNIVKTHVVSKLLFLATVFPSPQKTVIKLSKLCTKLIWGTNREVTQRKLMYKGKEHGGLGAPDLGIILMIPFLKNVYSVLERSTHWIQGKKSLWEKNERGSPNGSAIL